MQSPENKIIELKNIWKQYDNRCILENINLSIYKNDFIAITGPNGGGKTTLLKIILKLLNPTKGEVIYWKDGILSNNLKMGYLPQKNMIDSRFPISVREVIASGLLGGMKLFKSFTAEENEKINHIISEMGIDHLGEEALGNLSGGQMQRALLGRALISDPHVLVLDEPLSYVDKRFEHQIYNIISKIAPTTTIILVSHEMTSIAPIANRHLIIDKTLHECHAPKHYAITECED